MEILSLLTVLTILLSAEAHKYCSESLCKPGVKHIACRHSGQFSSRCPSNVHLVKLTPANIEQIVYLHNQKRNEVAGGGLERYRPATRMATMQWDEELASLAVYNVKQCEKKHDACHNTHTFKHSGQNLFQISYGGPSVFDETVIEYGINHWYKEHKDASMRFIDEFPHQYSGPDIEDFTEMVNENNTHVGCAASRWTENGFNHFLFTCNYAVTNLLDRPIYTSCSKPATGCIRKNPNFTNLCSIGEVNANTRNPKGNPGITSANTPQNLNTNPKFEQCLRFCQFNFGL